MSHSLFMYCQFPLLTFKMFSLYLVFSTLTRMCLRVVFCKPVLPGAPWNAQIYKFIFSPTLGHFVEKEMATHSSILAWRIPGTEEPGGLLSMGSPRVRHDWSDSTAAAIGRFGTLIPLKSPPPSFFPLYSLSSLLLELVKIKNKWRPVLKIPWADKTNLVRQVELNLAYFARITWPGSFLVFDSGNHKQNFNCVTTDQSPII